jgi:hypothetical protein
MRFHITTGRRAIQKEERFGRGETRKWRDSGERRLGRGDTRKKKDSEGETRKRRDSQDPWGLEYGTDAMPGAIDS